MNPVKWQVKTVRNKAITVEKVNDDRVDVTWICGATRSFRVDALEDTIKMMLLAAEHDAWLELQDSYERGFWAKVIDGRIYVAEHFTSQLGGVENSVRWDRLQAALREAQTAVPDEDEDEALAEEPAAAPA